MITCLCKASGFHNARELATHIGDKHKVDNAVRALMLAHLVADKKALRPEDYAIFDVEPPSGSNFSAREGTARERRHETQARELGLASDAALDAAIEAAGFKRCTRCNERPPIAGQEWCAECLTEAGKPTKPKRQRTPKKKDPARVAQLEERRGATPEVTGSSPVPRSTPTPETPAISTAPKETPMADEKKCAECKKPFTPTDARQSKCDEHARCGGCKQLRKDGHKDWCPRAKKGGKKAAGKKTGKKKAAKNERPHAGRVPALNGHGLNGKLDTMLTAEKAKVTDLREQLRTAEQRVQILTELAGA